MHNSKIWKKNFLDAPYSTTNCTISKVSNFFFKSCTFRVIHPCVPVGEDTQILEKMFWKQKDLCLLSIRFYKVTTTCHKQHSWRRREKDTHKLFGKSIWDIQGKVSHWKERTERFFWKRKNGKGGRYSNPTDVYLDEGHLDFFEKIWIENWIW